MIYEVCVDTYDVTSWADVDLTLDEYNKLKSLFEELECRGIGISLRLKSNENEDKSNVESNDTSGISEKG